jgi:hypothetical protein
MQRCRAAIAWPTIAQLVGISAVMHRCTCVNLRQTCAVPTSFRPSTGAAGSAIGGGIKTAALYAPLFRNGGRMMEKKFVIDAANLGRWTYHRR